MKRLVAFAVAVLLAGCAGVQSSAGADGAESLRIANLGGLFLIVAVLVYLFVLVLLVLAVRRGRAQRRDGAGVQGEPQAGGEGNWHLALVSFAGVTAAILFGLSLATWLTDRSIAQAAAAPVLEIEVIGHQWWWEIRYKDPVAGRELRTANELVIRAGRVSHVTLHSQDVIHSLWIPNLAGKQDLIPGRSSDLALKPLHVGQFRAQCAEFCGIQHAQMALTVNAVSDGDFAHWYEQGLKTPQPPGEGPPFAGYSLFLGRQCASCHNISGTPASGQVAPDLSHVGSRPTLAAGALANTPANLDRWIADPQGVKPGTNMPKVPLTPEERSAVVAYLETLK